jgi:hypothetical protein
MNTLFVESRGFTARVGRFLDDAAYAAFQQQLMEDPDRGPVMPGCGGLRKIRLADPKHRKGKRGGARMIYLHVPDANWILLLDIYGKAEKDDLSAAERTVLRRLAEQFKQEATAAVRRAGSRDPR